MLHWKSSFIRHWGLTPENPVCIADIREGASKIGEVDDKVEMSLEESFKRYVRNII